MSGCVIHGDITTGDHCPACQDRYTAALSAIDTEGDT